MMETAVMPRVGVSMETLLVWALACVAYWFSML